MIILFVFVKGIHSKQNLITRNAMVFFDDMFTFYVFLYISTSTWVSAFCALPLATAKFYHFGQNIIIWRNKNYHCYIIILFHSMAGRHMGWVVIDSFENFTTILTWIDWGWNMFTLNVSVQVGSFRRAVVTISASPNISKLGHL